MHILCTRTCSTWTFRTKRDAPSREGRLSLSDGSSLCGFTLGNSTQFSSSFQNHTHIKSNSSFTWSQHILYCDSFLFEAWHTRFPLLHIMIFIFTSYIILATQLLKYSSLSIAFLKLMLRTKHWSRAYQIISLLVLDTPLLCLKSPSLFRQLHHIYHESFTHTLSYNSMPWHSILWPFYFLPHRITLANGKVRYLSRVFFCEEEVSLICKFYLIIINLRWHSHLVTFTHLKAATHLFPETRVRSEVPNSSSWASHLLCKGNSLLPYTWASSVYFLIFHPQHPPIPLESKRQSFLWGVKMYTAGAQGCSGVHSMQNREHWERLIPAVA